MTMKRRFLCDGKHTHSRGRLGTPVSAKRVRAFLSSLMVLRRPATASAACIPPVKAIT
jgi:hypothetical protein